MQLNQTFEKQYTVKESETAQALGSGGLTVLSTPAMISYMENTSFLMLEEELDSEHTTVGIEVNVKHLAPTAVNKQVNVKATLVEVTSKVYVFHVEATVDGKLIGEGTHKRGVINPEQFLSSMG